MLSIAVAAVCCALAIPAAAAPPASPSPFQGNLLLSTDSQDVGALQRDIDSFQSSLALAGPQPQAAGQSLVVSSTNPNLANGVYVASNYPVPAGSTTYDNVYAGYNGGGAITHSVGTLSVSNTLYLGLGSSGSGSYLLSDAGVLSAGIEYVGYGGTGTFTQSGGTNTVSNALYLGQNPGSGNVGYTLSGGTLSAKTTSVGNAGSGTFTQDGGTHAVTGSLNLGGGSSGQDIYKLNNGTLSAADESVGVSGSGTFMQSGGTNTISNALTIGQNNNHASSYTLSGGTLSAASESVGDYGSGTFTQSGGTNTIRGNLSVKGNGGYTLSGGTLSASVYQGRGTFTQSGGTFSAANEYVGYNSNGTFTQSDGTNIVSNTLYCGYDSANSGITGTYTLGGGTLQARAIATGLYGGGTFNFDGGTLRAGVDNAFFIVGNVTTNVQEGGAKIDTNGYSITVAQKLAHDPALRVTMDGGLTKLGSGILALSGANTYDGGTTISAGALLAKNGSGSATGSGAVTVGNGGTLGGSGMVAGPVAVQGGGVLAPGLQTVSQLTLANTLTLNSGSLLAITIGGANAGSGYDQVVVGGAVTLGGSLQVTTINGYTPSLDQTFTILDNTGSELTLGLFSNVVSGIYTDAAGHSFLVNYAAKSDDGLVPNDVTLTYLGINVPEPGTWAMLGLGALSFLAVKSRRTRASAS